MNSHGNKSKEVLKKPLPIFSRRAKDRKKKKNKKNTSNSIYITSL